MTRTANMAKIRPLDDRVVVEPIEAEEKTAGGIVLPDTAKEKPQRGKVIAVGPGKLLDSGKRAPIVVVEVGDEVLFGKYARHRHRSRRRGDQDPPRERHPGEGRQVIDIESASRRASRGRATVRHSTTRESFAIPTRRDITWQNNCSSPTPPAGRCWQGVDKLADAVGITLGPDRPQRDHRQVVRRPDRHQGRRDRLARKSSWTTRSRTWAPSSSTRSPRRPPTSPATAPPPPPSWPGRSSTKACATSPPAANPMAVRRGIEKAVEAAVEKLDEHGQAGLQARRRSPRSARSAPTTTRRSAS